MAGIYFHIPFCKQACHYCDFHFSTSRDGHTDLIESITRELFLQRNYLNGEIINTIYFGGGTPSILHSDQLSSLLEEIHRHFNISSDAEITLEANPDDLDAQKSFVLRSLGINRLSIGIQSFDDHVLSFLNRAHNSKAALDCVHTARAAGFGNISIDLIYAIPGEDNSAWRSSLARAIDLCPEHISAYSLTIEEKTVFGKWRNKGKLLPTDDDKAAEQMEIMMDVLEAAGYEHYEVSNFSKPGFQSRHNSSYWKREKYLGVGPSAHSYNGATRQYNISNNHLYVKSITNGSIPCEIENLTISERINDYILTSLRTSWGCDTSMLLHEFQFNLVEKNRDYINKLIAAGMVTLDHAGILRLTRRGRLIADAIAADLFE